MNFGHCKKGIIFFCLIANLPFSAKARNFEYVKNNDNFSIKKIVWSKISEKNISSSKKVHFKKYVDNLKIEKKSSYPIFFESFQNKRSKDQMLSEKITFKKEINHNTDENTNKKVFFKKYKDKLDTKSTNKNLNIAQKNYSIDINNIADSYNELVIQSEIQSERNNILYAKGDVLVTYRDYLLKADSLEYDKNKKTIKAKGNISLNIGEQVFRMLDLEYDFINREGYLSEVKGLIKTNKLVDDIFSNFKILDIKEKNIVDDLQKKTVLYTPGTIETWIFSTNKIEIDGDTWKSKKAIFTNDLLELKQSKIIINSLEAVSKKEEIRFKSALNYMILDEKLSIPFWLGERNLSRSGEGLTFENRWNLGYEKVDKDGYFIGRKFGTVNLFNDFVLDLEPQFLIQRFTNGYTKSYVKENDSITGEKVKRDTSFNDYFALNSQIKGKINNWDLSIDKKINSFDSAKFIDGVRFKTNLSKEINFLNSQWKKSFFSVYRDRVWNGSIGEAEIYGGYGSKLEKRKTWEVDGISKNEIFSLGLANFKAEALNSKDLVKSVKGSLFYSFDQKFPISVQEPLDPFVDNSYRYISEPISKGVSFNTKLELFYSLYEKGNSQEYLGFGAGPEFIFGDFQKKSLDYTRLSLLPFYKIKSGESIFKFDQVSDTFFLNIAFDQQLYGPLIFKSSSTLNLDSNSDDYGDFLNSKISLNWKKRSYEFGIFYQPYNETGGIIFNLFGFK